MVNQLADVVQWIGARPARVACAVLGAALIGYALADMERDR